MKTEERVNQGCLAGAVRAEQTDRAATQFPVQLAEDGPAAEGDRQPLQINDRRFGVRSFPGSAGILPATSLQIIGRRFGARSLQSWI